MIRILIVEHSAETAESLSMLLAALGHQTRVSFDVFEAIDAATQCRPAVVFIDLTMPGLEAQATTRALRAAAAAAPTLIALTTVAGAAVNDAVRAAGFDAYMKKPLDTLAVIAVVTQIASRA